MSEEKGTRMDEKNTTVEQMMTTVIQLRDQMQGADTDDLVRLIAMLGTQDDSHGSLVRMAIVQLVERGAVIPTPPPTTVQVDDIRLRIHGPGNYQLDRV